jgi:gamma-glutamyltranspeptidase/glutathione hydrolase
MRLISSLLFSLLILAQCQAQQPQLQRSQWYTPFPYPIEKVATADSVMVVSAHPLATQVGIDILKKGGNAIDAAVAVHFALAVVYPQAGNLGGGGFLVYRDHDGPTATLDFREKAPAAATEKMYLDSLGNVLPNKSRFGDLACGVPGSVDGMWEAHKKYGKLPWVELVNPALALAEKGFQITEHEAQNLNDERFNFVRHSSLVPAFVKFDNWKAGDWLIQKDLAETLRRIAGNGRAGFYEAATAALIVHEMDMKNGLITAEDLTNYHSVWRKPLEFEYKSYHVITMPPPSSGGVILQQLLTMTSPFPLHTYGFHSAAAVHLMAEAESRAYADRAEFMGDPDFIKFPVKGLTDTTYLKSGKMIKAGHVKESEQTTHFSIVDRDGNAVAVTTTLNDSYGSRAVVAGAGFILNNEMDDFSVKPGTPNLYGAIGGKANAIAPNKRPLSSMTPTIVTRAGKLWLVVGTPGGTTIPTSVFQIIVNAADFGLSLPEAVKAKRFHHQWRPDAIQMEDGALSDDIQAKLTQMGHAITVRQSAIGRVEAIMRLPEGKLQGVADDRGDDCAQGF